MCGQTVNGWKIGACLGACGFGAAFAVEKDGEKAVMKLPLVASKATVDFAVEAATMKKIQAPQNIEKRNSNICQLLCQGTTDIPELKVFLPFI